MDSHGLPWTPGHQASTVLSPPLSPCGGVLAQDIVGDALETSQILADMAASQ